MNELEKIIKTAVDSAKLVMLDFDRELTDEFSPRLDYVSITIHPDKYEELKKDLSHNTTLIFESKDNPTIKLHGLNKPIEVASGQTLNKIAFKLKVTKSTKLEYVSFVVESLATLHTYLTKHKNNPSNMDSYTDGNKQFFVETSGSKIAFTKRGFAESEELETLKKRLDEEIDSKLRILADYQNYKRRSEETSRNNTDMANKHLLNHVIEIVDDCNRAIENNEQSVEILLSKLKQILTEQGLEEIPVNKGDVFDPKTMEAITSTPVMDDQKPNTVAHVDQKGYKQANSETIYRPSKVVVTK